MERQTARTVPFSQLGSNPSVDARRVTLEQETDPLLPYTQTLIRRVAPSRGYGTHTHPQDGIDELASEGFQIDSDTLANHSDEELVPRKPAKVPDGKRELGLISTSLLILNRMIGSGIFATPSVILRSSGSIGFSLVMWLLGASVAACGTAVFIELGTGIPKSGGDKNYLEFLYQRPRLLSICIYATYAVIGASQAAGPTVFSEYILHAINPATPPPAYLFRFVAFGCITFAMLLHGTRLHWGIRLQNALGFFKIVVLLGMALGGLASLAGLPGFRLEKPPQNFRWGTMWHGTLNGGANAFVLGLYNVIWCFDGYSNANYALSEVRDPVRTIKRAAPLAVFAITSLYMLVNVAYYVVVDKEEILGSGRIAAALFFGKLWGLGTERFVSLIIAFSALGSVMAILFGHGRVIQELGKEGVVPFSGFFSSDKPFNTPLAGLLTQWSTTSIVLLLVPPGDAYLFFLNRGLLLLDTSVLKQEWNPPFKAWRPVVTLFFVSNVFLVLVPLVPPANGFKPYESLPYWLHVAAALSVALLGVVYWYVFTRWLPARGGYRLVRERVVDEDGIAREVLSKVEGL